VSITVNDLIRVLESVLGFEPEDGDHVRYVLTVRGKIIARTKFSRSWRRNYQIDDSILSLIAKQLHCSIQLLKALLRRRVGKEDYFKELVRGGFMSQDDYDFLLDEKR
jgi:hypothetical protein